MQPTHTRIEAAPFKRSLKVGALILYNLIASFFAAELDAVTFTTSITFQKALVNVAVVFGLNVAGVVGAWRITRNDEGNWRKTRVYAVNFLLFLMLITSIAYTAQFMGGGLIY